MELERTEREQDRPRDIDELIFGQDSWNQVSQR